MGDIIDFSELTKDPGREETELAVAAVRAQISELDAREPEDMDSEAYVAWADAHESLEDWLDELLDRLDALSGK